MPDETRLIAGSCSTCHGQKGEAYGVSKQLVGGKADELYQKLMAFRELREPSTVMKEITQAYPPETLRKLADHFSMQNATTK